MEIVTATKEQLPVVQQLAHTIWPKTYGGIISDAQIAYMLEMMYSVASLEKQLEEHRVFILVSENDQYIGFASYEVNCDQSNKTKIHKLYVLPETQGKGVGRQLVDYITGVAVANQDTALILTVNKNNPAISFYSKIGFEITSEAVFDIGNGYVMDDYIMEKKR